MNVSQANATSAPTPPVQLLNGWHLRIPWCQYVLLTFGIGIVIRVLTTALKSWEGYYKQRPPRAQKFTGLYVAALKGFGSAKPSKDDYWFPFVLGWFELLAFPVLMYNNTWAYVGAWLGFKTVAQWEAWKNNRPTFNRFLIGTAMVLLAAFWLAREYFK